MLKDIIERLQSPDMHEDDVLDAVDEIRNLRWTIESVTRRLASVCPPHEPETVDETAQRAANLVALRGRALNAIVKSARREVYWELPEAGRVAEEALQGKDTFLNMLEFQGDISRQRKRDELQVVSRQTFDEFAAWVKERLEAMGAKEKGDEGNT